MTIWSRTETHNSQKKEQKLMENEENSHKIIIQINKCDGTTSEVVHETNSHAVIQDVFNTCLSEIGYSAAFTALKRKGGGGT